MVLQYQEYGDKSAPLMMFLHGGGVSDWMWDQQIHYFTKYHCIVPILSEHGVNHDGTPFSIEGSAEELIPLIEEKAGGEGSYSHWFFFRFSSHHSTIKHETRFNRFCHYQ